MHSLNHSQLNATPEGRFALLPFSPGDAEADERSGFRNGRVRSEPV